MISWSEFERMEIMAGTIIQVDDFPEARNPAYKLKIDFGKYGVKKSSAQITKLYNKDDLLGKQVVAVTNFPPKQVAGFMSECLVLGVPLDNNDVVLLEPERKVPNGHRIS